MTNLRNIQFLRNAENYASLEAAKTALIAKAATALDGSAILGRYTSGSETRTILGLVANGTVSFFNNDKEIDNILDGLDFGPVGGGSADVISWVQEVNGQISATSVHAGTLLLTDYVEGTASGHVEATDSINAGIAKLQNQIDAEIDSRNAAINALDAASVSGANKVVIDVTQEDGQITATAANLTGIKLAGYAEGTDADIAETDTLGEALGKLQAQINAMDKDASAVAGQVVTTVAETDGKVTETKANVKDLQLGGYEKSNETGAIASADTINSALSKLENTVTANKITNVDGSVSVTTAATGTDIKVHIKTDENVIKLDGEGGGIYTDLDLVKITSGLPAEIKERYQLLDSDDNPIGQSIDIPKDSHIVSINYITTSGDAHYQNLEYVYIDASGNTQTAYVDMAALVLEVEVENGIQEVEHKLSIKLDTTGDDTGDGKFLTVGANGLKLDGVTDAISAAVESLDATVSAETTSKHVSVKIDEVDGKLTTVTINDSDIASAEALAQEITDRGNADTALSNRLGDGVTSANTASAQFAALSGNSNSVSGDTSVEGAKRYADAILANSVAGLDADVSGNSAHVTVGVVEENGVITAVTVTEEDVANATDLAALSAKTITELTSANNSIAISDGAIAADGTMSFDLATDASKISGLTAYASADKGAAKISGVAASDSVQTAVDNLYKSIASEIDARKAAISARTISGSNAISVTETPNADGFGTSIDLILDDTTVGVGNEKTGDYNALTITNDGLFLSTTWECGTF